MAVSPKIKSYLDYEKVDYQLLEHELAYTSMEIAGSQHIPGHQVIKPVIFKADGKFVMCVLPSIHYVDIDKLKKLTDAKEIRLATEEEFSHLFPDYEVGAEPPFGHLHGLKVIADRILDEDEDVVFNAGTHTDMIKMKWTDFKKIVNPTVADVGVHIQTARR